MRKGKAISVRGVPVRGHFINAYAMKTVVINFYDHHFTAGMGGGGGGMLDERFGTHVFKIRRQTITMQKLVSVLIARSVKLIRGEKSSSSALGPDGCSEMTLSSAPESSDICLSIFCRRSSCWTGRALKIVQGRKTRFDKTNHDQPAAGSKIYSRWSVSLMSAKLVSTLLQMKMLNDMSLSVWHEWY